MLKVILEKEGIPSVIDCSGNDRMQPWCLRVDASYLEAAQRTLSNCSALGTHIDWDDVDVGEPSGEVKAVLASSEAIRRFSGWVWGLGLLVGFVVIGLGILGVVLSLLR